MYTTAQHFEEQGTQYFKGNGIGSAFLPGFVCVQIRTYFSFLKKTNLLRQGMWNSMENWLLASDLGLISEALAEHPEES